MEQNLIILSYFKDILKKLFLGNFVKTYLIYVKFNYHELIDNDQYKTLYRAHLKISFSTGWRELN